MKDAAVLCNTDDSVHQLETELDQTLSMQYIDVRYPDAINAAISPSDRLRYHSLSKELHIIQLSLPLQSTIRTTYLRGMLCSLIFASILDLSSA
jgi:hypothetical protein